MPRLTWGDVGTRFFETGVDRGVLYAPSQPGVAWSGLIGVNETPTGGDAKPFYLDGLKYVNVAAAEEFGATISAVSSPAEFGPCDGTTSVHNGLFVTQQPRVAFGFSYRSLIGNDVNGIDHAYKVHLVYGALAKPSSQGHNTISDSTTPDLMSWDITTLPPAITGYKPTAHLVIDSRYADPEVLSDFEDVIYGTDALAAALPTVDDVVSFFA